MALASGGQPKFAVVSKSAAATAEIVAAVTGKRIRVLAYTLVASGGANSVNWENGTTDITGVMDLPNDTSLSASSPDGLFETSVGTALQLTQSAATLVAGHVTYIEV